MPSGKRSRRSRQAAAAPVRRRQASTPVLIGVAIALVLLVVVAVLAVGRVDRSSSKASASRPEAVAKPLPGAAGVQRLLGGIPQRGNLLGSPSAPVSMIEYVDLQCPYCGLFETRAMPTVISRYVRTGKLKVEARVIAFIGPNSSAGRKAAIAAGNQDRLFNFMQILFLNQGKENTGWLGNAMMRRAATSIPGLHVARLLSERNSPAVALQAQRFDADKTAANVQVTPTVFVGKSGTALHPLRLASPSDAGAVLQAVDAALR
jgi:protein-disulfide isomerase